MPRFSVTALWQVAGAAKEAREKPEPREVASAVGERMENHSPCPALARNCGPGLFNITPSEKGAHRITAQALAEDPVRELG